MVPSICFFFFNDTATTEIYTLSLHDALPISVGRTREEAQVGQRSADPERHQKHRENRLEGAGFRPSREPQQRPREAQDRKSTRLNSSHANISYAVFCLKKKKKRHIDRAVEDK